MAHARITITLPEELVWDIDRRERNRSRFILKAVERELEARRRQELLASIEHPHPHSEELAEAGFEEWVDRAHPKDEGLLDPDDGALVRWSSGHGWTEIEE